MTRRLLDFNPLSKEAVWFNYDAHTDQMTISHEQDVEPIKELTHAMATDGNYSKRGMKEDWWHYAKVPNIVIMEMKQKHGVDFFDPNHSKRVFELLNGEYRLLKTTDRTHNVRG
jgi:hypothetical protein